MSNSVESLIKDEKVSDENYKIINTIKKCDGDVKHEKVQGSLSIHTFLEQFIVCEYLSLTVEIKVYSDQ